MKVVLASGSPRRRQLLEQVGIPHRVIVSDVDESIDGPPDEQVKNLALRKADAVYEMLSHFPTKGDKAVSADYGVSQNDTIIIAADTLVSIDNKVLGKPATADEAFAMLKSLSARQHTVYTGVAVLHDVTRIAFVSTAHVFFRDLTDYELLKYIASGEPFDKAGGYGVQEKGALLVERIDGDFYTVMGLPVARLAVILRELGVDV